ncbi:putative Cell morphogenesis protein PAG1 [Glarea lozoyensis 74030]|uniref:Putative Cell morphogenesis protein PAG1 n=1 Tax=Glarea lozoyensis (strain ATCC 74030 / MF5533) TaxID=1104152 RepID=H0EIU1_GLAL7|nr:putative Cell morphogenesis protein PAG1 [Glarea lozoyensis 74030]
MDGEVQMDWEFQKLRRHYCGLMEELFEGINRTKDTSRWMTFESRKSSFALMEDWCGYSPNQTQIRQREDSMRQSMIDQQSLGERGTVTAAMEIEKRNLKTAALSAMAALCGGPVSVTTESKANLQFDIRPSSVKFALNQLGFYVHLRKDKQKAPRSKITISDLQPDAQRNMVAVILPWIQIIELQLDPNGGPTAYSYVLLANLFEITIKSSSGLHHEVQALWQALATGPHAGNVQLVLDFIMSLCLDRREQNFVEYAKQIVVFLSTRTYPATTRLREIAVVTVLWDHYIPLVQEQAREMLIHLMHELVLSKTDDEFSLHAKKSIEDFIESIRRHDVNVVWAYEDNNGKVDDQDNKVPASMENLTTEVVKFFEVSYPGVQERWGKLSLTWATSCPVRHLACRSFQIFRCILTSLDQPMLADMLARLSNTIADDDKDVQTFSMEILTTLKTLICKLEPSDLLNFPQLFWTTCACLDTINEREFLEALGMLEELMVRLDFSDPAVRCLLLDGRPPRWEGHFGGLQALVYKGLRSSVCSDLTLRVLNNLVQLPDDELIGDDSRLLFAILGNFPGFLNAMDQSNIDAKSIKTAEILAEVAEASGYSTISRALSGFAASRYRSSKDFLSQLVSALRETFFPQWDFGSLTFLMDTHG